MASIWEHLDEKNELTESIYKTLRSRKRELDASAWLVGALTMYVALEDLQTISRIATENYGERK